MILNFKGYNLNWMMVVEQRTWCSIKESRIVIHIEVLACTALLLVLCLPAISKSVCSEER